MCPGLVDHQKEFQLHALLSRIRVFFIKNRFEIAGVLKHTVILQGKIEKFDFFFGGGGVQMCRINILRLTGYTSIHVQLIQNIQCKIESGVNDLFNLIGFNVRLI